jgi:hypothetical protein
VRVPLPQDHRANPDDLAVPLGHLHRARELPGKAFQDRCGRLEVGVAGSRILPRVALGLPPFEEVPRRRLLDPSSIGQVIRRGVANAVRASVAGIGIPGGRWGWGGERGCRFHARSVLRVSGHPHGGHPPIVPAGFPSPEVAQEAGSGEAGFRAARTTVRERYSPLT